MILNPSDSQTGYLNVVVEICVNTKAYVCVIRKVREPREDREKERVPRTDRGADDRKVERLRDKGEERERDDRKERDPERDRQKEKLVVCVRFFTLAQIFGS